MYAFKKHEMIDGKRYGPTGNGWYYQPADYHGKVSKTQSKKGKKAKEKEHEVRIEVRTAVTTKTSVHNSDLL